MPGPDATASAALGASVLHPCWVGWLDFSGDPVRVTTAPYSVTFTGTGDTDLDGFTFEAANPQFIKVGPVKHREDGSETVTATMSGMVTVDTDLLNIIGNPALWRGRAAALWLMLYDTNLARIGNVWRFYTGTMVAAPISGSPEEQSIDIQIESYLASLSQPSGRTYLDQQNYDAGDLSAAAAIAIANGTGGAGLYDTSGANGMPGVGGGGGRFNSNVNML